MRPRIDIDDATLERVVDYASAEGVRMDRAYADLITHGLDAVETDE